MTIPLSAFLILGAALFAIGLYGAVSRNAAVQVLMSLELMSMAVSLNLVAFSTYVTPQTMSGQFFTVFAMVISAAEVGIGLALVVALFRTARTAELDELNKLRG